MEVPDSLLISPVEREHSFIKIMDPGSLQEFSGQGKETTTLTIPGSSLGVLHIATDVAFCNGLETRMSIWMFLELMLVVRVPWGY